MSIQCFDARCKKLKKWLLEELWACFFLSLASFFQSYGSRYGTDELNMIDNQFALVYFSLFLIYLNWFYEIRIKFSSISVGDVQNLEINHRQFRLRVHYINFFSLPSIFLRRVPNVVLNNIHLTIHTKTNQTSTKSKSSNNWKGKLALLKVNLPSIVKLNKYSCFLVSFDSHRTIPR